MITEITETTYSTGSAPYTVTTRHTSETRGHPSETRTHTYETTPPRTFDSTTQPPEATDPSHKASQPVRKKVVRKKVDTSKFRTPYLDHSSKMQKLFSEVSQKCVSSHIQSHLILLE